MKVFEEWPSVSYLAWLLAGTLSRAALYGPGEAALPTSSLLLMLSGSCCFIILTDIYLVSYMES